MNLLAIKEGLEKDIQRFEKRVAFQEKYVKFLRTNDYESEAERYEALDKAYQTELDSLKNRSFIKKFKKSLADTEKRLADKDKHFKDMPEKIKEAEESIKLYRKLIDEVKKSPKVTAKQKADRNMWVQGNEASYESCVGALEGVKGGFESQKEVYPTVSKDYETLEQVIKIAKGKKAK